ncbi:MAG: hypothetical protein QM778_26300 [Myxococcales bacterium]
MLVPSRRPHLIPWFMALALGLAACSESSDHASDSGSLMSSHDGGGDGDGDGDASTAPSDAGRDGSTTGPLSDGGLTHVSARAACRAYVQAQCDRRAYCKYANVALSCEVAIAECPDFLFAPGSTRDPATVLACAKAWSKLSCEDALSNVVPACASAGTRALGEACVFSSQCASRACSGSPTSCGVCVAPLNEGATCNNTTPPCAPGLACEQGMCAKIGKVTPYAEAKAGEPCDPNGGNCVKFFSCEPDASSSTGNRCVELPLGTECSRDECPATSYCPRALPRVCTALPKVGQDCADSSAVGNPYRYCELNAYCESISNTCTAGRGPGSACTNNECTDGLACAEIDAQGYGKCRAIRDEGASCSDPNDRCAAGTECQTGTCVALASLGLFESACKP